MNIHRCAEWLSALFAVLAAAAWVRSATVKVRAEHQSGLNAAVPGGYVHFVSKGITYDMHKTIQQQSWWNACAAILASIAGVCQVFSAAALALKRSALADLDGWRPPLKFWTIVYNSPSAYNWKRRVLRSISVLKSKDATHLID
jgi:hypothetical protein